MIHRAISDVRDLSEIVRAGERIVLTEDDKPVAVILDPDDFRSLEASVMLANDPDNLARVLAAAEQLRLEEEACNPFQLDERRSVMVNGVQLLTQRVDTPGCDLRALAERFREQHKNGVVILGTASGENVKILTAVTQDLIEQVSASKLLTKLAPMIGGKATGGREVAEAGGTRPERLERALTSATEILREVLAD